MEKHSLAATAQSSESVTKYIRFLDKYVCGVVHNPILASLVVLVSVIYLQGVQFHKVYEQKLWELVFIGDFHLDTLQQLVNLVFVLRFTMGKFGGPVTELALFLLNNVGCCCLLFWKSYSLLYSNVQFVLKLFIVWQILCPYGIMCLNHYEYMRYRMCGRTPKSLVNWHQEVMSWNDFLIDTNNNFLPIFIAHSFASININFHFIDKPYILLAYRVANILLKFYCVYQYILYELAISVYGTSFNSEYWRVYDYDEDVSAWKRLGRLKLVRNCCLLGCILVCIGFNFLYIIAFHTSN